MRLCPELKQRKLAILLEQHVSKPVNPKRRLEQYRTPPETALLMVSMLQSTWKCITILDLGCGTGMLAYAASIAAKMYTVGVDIDEEQVVEAVRSSLYKVALADFVQADVEHLPLRASAEYCVVQNPPFGVWQRGADMKFLRAALQLKPKAIVTMHKNVARSVELILKILMEQGYRIKSVVEDEIIIPAMYETHRRRTYRVKVAIIAASLG